MKQFMNTFESKIFTFQDSSFSLRRNATSLNVLLSDYSQTLRQRLMVKLFKMFNN